MSMKENVLQDSSRGLGFKLFVAASEEGRSLQKMEGAAKILNDIS